MNTDVILPKNLVKQAKAVWGVSQTQMKEVVTLYKDHGNQFISDGKAFYQDLRKLQKKSFKELQQAWKKPLKPKAKAKKSTKTPKSTPEPQEI